MTGSSDEREAIDLATIVTTILIFAILVMCFASVCYRWSNRQFNSLQSINEFTDSDIESTTVRGRAARGLNAATVESFPTFLYSEVKEKRIGKGGVECAVCLCEFEDDEILRMLPVCCHVFHADCVNVWLSDHTTCPLCRVDFLFLPRGVLIPDSGTERRRVLDSMDLECVTWTNRNTPGRSKSTRILSHCGRVSDVLFSRSNSTGHCMVQPIENQERFTLRLPEDVRRQLKEKAVGQARSMRRSYRSRSVGSERRNVFSSKHNVYNDNRGMDSRTFSFSDCVRSSSGRLDVVVSSRSLPRLSNYGERRSSEGLEGGDGE